MPKFLKMGFEAENGMIRASAPFLGVVADPGKLGFAIEGQDHGIEVEDEAGSRRWQSKQLVSELIV